MLYILTFWTKNGKSERALLNESDIENFSKAFLDETRTCFIGKHNDAVNRVVGIDTENIAFFTIVPRKEEDETSL